ncbi:hypothetical protein ACE193_11900 [Bernardetia sp. OM2101]|uniref:hypothetical protein n=1 Tax=Bernardetia sp. OM2101 TaxID=3344876 RepID=UPI0035CEB349
MNQSKINSKPFHVIQIFSNSYYYDKEYKEFETRKEWVKWKKEIESSTKIENKTILVNKHGYQNHEGVLDNLVILLDSNFYTEEDEMNLSKLNSNYGRYTYNRKEKQRVVFSALSFRKTDLEIFKVRQNKNTQKIELFFHWNYWNTGINKKGDFKLYNLEINKPVNIKTDKKIDGERKKRTFLENNYIIEYKGVIEQIEVLKDNPVFYKEIPNLEEIKKINLMKHLK